MTPLRCSTAPYGIFARSCVAMAKNFRSTFKIIDDNRWGGRDVVVCSRYPTRQSITRNKLPKGPYGPFGVKPARASAFISVSILMDTDARKGIGVRQVLVLNTN